MIRFKIRCEVSGGVTGYRVGYLQEGIGKTRVFDNQDAAEIEANKLTAKMNTPYASATFRYTVEDHHHAQT